MHLAHLVHEEEDADIVVPQSQLLEVVQNRLDEHLRVIRGH